LQPTSQNTMMTVFKQTHPTFWEIYCHNKNSPSSSTFSVHFRRDKGSELACKAVLNKTLQCRLGGHINCQQ